VQPVCNKSRTVCRRYRQPAPRRRPLVAARSRRCRCLP